MKTSGLTTTVIFTIWLVAIVGWGMNIYKFTQCDFDPIGKCEGVRAVGLIPVVGAITGYMTFDSDGK